MNQPVQVNSERVFLSYDENNGSYIIRQSKIDYVHMPSVFSSNENRNFTASHDCRKNCHEEEIVQNVEPQNIRPQPPQRSSELQHHWEEECKKDASLAKRFFYFGTVSLMIAICILAGARFWLVYDSFVGTFIFAAICMSGLLVSLQYFAWGKNKKNIDDEKSSSIK